MQIREIINWETQNAEPVRLHDLTITPQAQAVTLRLPIPFPMAGPIFIWNRPVSVLVEKENETMRIPIYNVNRLSIIVMAGISTIFLLIFIIMGEIFRKKGSKSI